MAPPRVLFSTLLLSSLMLVIFAGNYDYQSAQHPIVDSDHKRTLLNHHQLLNDHNLQSKPEKYNYYYEKPNPVGNKENIATFKSTCYGEQQNHGEGVRIPTKNKFIAIQGLILCNSGQKYVPIEGAKARITCEATKNKINKGHGNWPTSFSIETDETDENGLFLETFSLSYIQEVKLNLEKCKVFLEAPTTESKCKVATDVNNGKSGARLSLLRILNDKILYTVGPFIYT